MVAIYLPRDLVSQFNSDAIDQQAKLTLESLNSTPPLAPPEPPTPPPPSLTPPPQPADQLDRAQPPAQPQDTPPPPTPVPPSGPPALNDLLSMAGLGPTASTSAPAPTSAPTPTPDTSTSPGGPPALSDLLNFAGLGDTANAVKSAATNVASTVQSAGPPPLQDVLNSAGLGDQPVTTKLTQQVDKVQQAVQGVASRVSQFAMGLDNNDAYAFCGPAAAIAFAQTYGRNPTVTEAKALAQQVGWNPDQGMAGMQSEQRLLGAMGIQTNVEQNVDWSHVAQDASSGNPVILDTPGHYYYVSGTRTNNNGETEFDVGTSGTDLKGGGEWMTAAQINAMPQSKGTVRGALYADNPNSPTPSVANGPQPATQTTAGLSGGGATSGQVGDRGQQILNGAVQAASWLGDQGQKALQAVLVTEGGLNNARGDQGKSAGPLQFYEGGQLANLAQQMGMGLDQAKNWVEQNPIAAVQWAIGTPDKPGYLGAAIQNGLSQGLSGPDLATFAQRTGQVSVSPERAGANWNSLFGAGQNVVSGAANAVQGAATQTAQDLAQSGAKLADQGQSLLNNLNTQTQSLADYTRQKLAPINAEADRLTAANQQAADQTLQANQAAMQQNSLDASQAASGGPPGSPSKPLWQSIGDTIGNAISQGLQPLVSAFQNPTMTPPAEGGGYGSTFANEPNPTAALNQSAQQAGQAVQNFATQGGPVGAQNAALQTIGSNVVAPVAQAIAQPGGLLAGPKTAAANALESAAQNTGNVPVVSGAASAGLQLGAGLLSSPTVLDSVTTIANIGNKYGGTPDPAAMTPEDRQAYQNAMLAVGGLVGGEGAHYDEFGVERGFTPPGAKEPPSPATTTAAPVAEASVSATPAPTGPLERFGLTAQPVAGQAPLNDDELLSHYQGLQQRYETNDTQIARLEDQLHEASAPGVKPIRPQWAVGIPNEALIELAHQRGVSPYQEDWWEAAGLSQGSGEVRGIMGDLRGRSTQRFGGSSLANVQSELSRLRAENEGIMDAAEQMTAAEPGTLYRAAQTPAALPFGEPSNAVEPPAGTAAAERQPSDLGPPEAAGTTRATAPAAPARTAAGETATGATEQPAASVVQQSTDMLQSMLDEARRRGGDPATLDQMQTQIDALRPAAPEPAVAAAAETQPATAIEAPPQGRQLTDAAQALAEAPTPIKQVADDIGATTNPSRAFDLNALADMRAQYQATQPPLISVPPRTSKLDKFIGYTVANMLSGVSTAVHITTSQALQTLGRPVVEAVSGHPIEAVRDMSAMTGAVSDAFAAFGRTFATGMRANQTYQARALGGPIGTVLSAPLRYHTAANEFFRVLNAAGGSAAEASRLLRENPDLSFQDVLSKYTNQIATAGADAGARATYLNGGGLAGQLGERLGQWRAQMLRSDNPTDKAIGLLTQWVLPMTRIPGVILGEGIRGLPVVNEVRGLQRTAQLASQGQHYAAQQELGRTALTTFANMAILGEVLQGNITGDGPTSSADKQRLMEGADENGNATWRPNSIRLPGGRWLDYSGLGPIALSMSSISNLMDTANDYVQKPVEQRGDVPQLAQELLSREAQTIGNSWYLKGLADVLTGIKEGTIGGTASSLTQVADRIVPAESLLNEIRGMTDPYARQPQNVLQREESRIPGLSQNVPPRLAATTGQPEEQPRDVLSTLFRGTPPGMMTPNPVAAEASRLTEGGNRVTVPYEVKSYAGVPQTPDQQRLIQTQVGQGVNQYALNVMQDPKYASLSDAQKADALSKAIGQAQAAASITLSNQVARSPHESALLQWSQTPQYAGVSSKLAPEDIARQNWQISQAKSKLSDYRKQYGEQAEARLRRDDPQAYKLSQRDSLDSDVLQRRKRAVDKATGGALLQTGETAATGGLVGAGSTTLPPAAIAPQQPQSVFAPRAPSALLQQQTP